MGISEGKSLLYTAAAGIAPEAILPVCIDVGTNNPELLNDPAYAGLKQERIHGEEYDQLVEEFIGALKAWRPHFLLQFEDFANHTAFVLLEKYRHELCCFNDDIQGTACIALAGILSALRAQGKQQGGGEPSPSLADQTILFYGAGEAGAGIGELIAFALERRHGLTRQQGRQRCFFMDSKGLVTKSRLASLQTHKVPFAHDVPNCPTLLDAIKTVKPTVLIGVSTIPSSFNPQVLHEMSKLNTRPIIFPLSNPTSKSECTFEQAYNGTNGSVLFASGSPFPPLTDSETGITHYPAQSNNAYIFPAVGHAAVLTKAREINDDVFLVAAETLAKLSSEKELQIGRLFPRFSGICDVSAKIMAAVAEFMCATGLGEVPRDFISVSTAAAGRLEDWEAYSKKHMYGQSQKGGGGGGDARL
jgi:malate dehydrogenase (oxaloacetate-decarboxylating)(NADP+)